jgi:hypothetical protein
MGMNRSSKGLDFAVSSLDFGNQFHDGVMLRLCFDLPGIARAHIGPGTVITDSTPKVILAAPSRLATNRRNKIAHYPSSNSP